MESNEYPKRKQMRIEEYDYSRSGAYFVTVCTHQRQRLFGEDVIIPKEWYKEAGVMQYGDEKDYLYLSSIKNNSSNDGKSPISSVGAYPHFDEVECACVRPCAAQIIERWLHKIPQNYNNTVLDYYVIMPDHIHFVLFLFNETGAHMGAPLQCEDEESRNISVSDIVKWFKTMTTNEYIRLVKQNILPPFNKHIWQRGYYDHVIRNRDDLYECRKYIKNNPLKYKLSQVITIN